MEANSIAIVFAVLFAVSEALSLIPGIQANGIFQMIWNVLKIFGGYKKE